ncbi:mitochondrial carrier domain-containing protein [Obelidium mucronatum]|nr:mitochondrial carrier domain-containing protein [Obelidium mucronatum]
MHSSDSDSAGKNNSSSNTGLGDVIYGSVAGVMGKYVEYPFDTIKVRLQTQPLTSNHLAPTFKGPVDVFMKTLQVEGFFGLYKGISAPLVGAMIENSGLFLCYNQIQWAVRSVSNVGPDAPLSITQLSTCGFFSGAIVSMVLTPVELIKCKLQVQGLNKHVPTLSSASSSSSINGGLRPTYNGPLHIIKTTLKTEGLAGFYRGHLGTFLRESGGGAAWFGTYEYVCKAMIERNAHKGVKTKDDLTPVHLMGAGALAGMMFNFSLFPADVIKSRQQTMDSNSTGKRGFGEIAKEIYATQGIKGFYRGCGITVARSAPTSGVIFMSYELLRRNFPI